MSEQRGGKGERLEEPLELDLHFRWKMVAVTSREAGEGEYVGSGEGTIRGARIEGTVRWDLFERRENGLCRSNLTGTVTTVDGAQVRLDSRGFFIQPDESDPIRWITAASVHFVTADPRYEWLNRRLAVWEGDFNMDTFRHQYHVLLLAAGSSGS